MNSKFNCVCYCCLILFPLNEFRITSRFDRRIATFSNFTTKQNVGPSECKSLIGLFLIVTDVSPTTEPQQQSPIPIDYGQPLFLWLSRD